MPRRWRSSGARRGEAVERTSSPSWAGPRRLRTCTAICAGPEAHPDPDRRWPAPVAAGFTYLVFGLTASLAAAFIAASPPLLIQAVAGLALFSSLAASLAAALSQEDARLPAILTFVTTASGITIVGVGAPFWGLVGGIALLLLLRSQAQK